MHIFETKQKYAIVLSSFGGAKMDKAKKQKMRNGLEFILFCFPALAIIILVTIIPFLMNIFYSFYEWNGISKHMKFVGMGNFVKIFTDDKLFIQSFKFTLKFTIFYVVFANIIALAVSFVVAKNRKSNSIVRSFYYIPHIISLTAISLIWSFILGPGFEALYHITGWEFFSWSWVGTPKLAFYVIVIMTVWQNVGFYLISYVTGILAIPKDVLEAAKIDGASQWQQIKSIQIPLIMPAISICLLTSLTYGFKVFDMIMVFTKGGPANSTVSVAYNIYKEAFVNSNYGLATAKSLVFFAVVLIVTIIQVTQTKRKEIEA